MPVFTPGQPVVQATPPLEERIAAATAAAEAEQAAAKATPPRPAPVRTVERREPAASSSSAMKDEMPAPVVPVIAPATLPVTVADQGQDMPVAVAPVMEATTESAGATDQALLWAMGGGALLLLGLGGAAMVRRRRPDDPVDDLHMTDPVLDTPAPAAVPVAIVPRPAMASTVARTARLHGDATLEAMVAAGPSQDNPFRTRTKRLRRAKYLIAQREAAAVAPAEPLRTERELAPSAPIDRSQTVYRFGGQGAPSGFLKPRMR